MARLLELAFFGGTILLATGFLDFLFRLAPQVAALRSALWAVLYLCYLGLFVLNPHALYAGLTRAWPILIWPAVAIASLAWSVQPGETARAAIQLLTITLFGVYVGTRVSLRELTALTAGALAIGAVLSLGAIVGTSVGYDHNGDAIGAYSHKNVLGLMMANLSVLATVLALAGVRPLVNLPLALFGAAMLAVSGSATSLVAAVTAFGVVALVLAAALPGPARLAVLATGAAAAGATLALGLSGLFDPARLLFEATGKDVTLTGRTVLWDFALRSIEDHPLLGVGYHAFWSDLATERSAWVRWVMDQKLDNFHNGFVDVAVQLGALGVGVMLFALGVLLVRALRVLRADPGSIAMVPMVILALTAVGMMAEVMVFQRHGFMQFMLSALLSCTGTMLAREARSAPATPPAVALGRPAARHQLGMSR